MVDRDRLAHLPPRHPTTGLTNAKASFEQHRPSAPARADTIVRSPPCSALSRSEGSTIVDILVNAIRVGAFVITVAGYVLFGPG